MVWLFLLLGAIFGSFYLVIGTRLPLKENVITSRSRCDNCKHELKWYDLIPIFSYVFLKGQCRYCHQKIKAEHLIMEIACAILFAIGYLYFGFTTKLGIYLVIISVALIIFVSDFKYMYILDSPLIIGSILIIILRYFELGFLPTIYSIIYGILAFLIMFAIKLFGDKAFKRESLGGGDIKLSFLIGLVLGYPMVGLRMSMICLVFSAFLAFPYAISNIYLNKKNELPYGPFLIATLVIIFVFFDKFINILTIFELS